MRNKIEKLYARLRATVNEAAEEKAAVEWLEVVWGKTAARVESEATEERAERLEIVTQNIAAQK